MIDTMSGGTIVGGNPFGLKIDREDIDTTSRGMFIGVDPSAAGKALRVRQVVVGRPLGSDLCMQCTLA